MSQQEPTRKKARRIIGTNVAIALFCVAAILGLVNYLAFRHPARWDLTRARLYTLSDKTIKTLVSLEKFVEIAVFYQPTHALYKKVYDLLREAEEKAKGHLKIEYVDPDKDMARTQQLAARLKVDALNTFAVACGGKIKQVGDTDLVEYDFSQMSFGAPPKMKGFKGEEALVNALLSVTEEKQRQVYFLTGHGEKEIDSQQEQGIAALNRLLEKNNMKGEKLLLLGKKKIPKEADLVVIAGPTKPITQEEKGLLKKFVAGGGGLWVLADPLTETELEPLVKEWGIELGKDVVVDPSVGIPFVSAANLFIHSYGRHPITQNMSSVATLFVMTRSVAELPASPTPRRWQVTPLAATTEAGWGETSVISQTFEFNEKEDKKGPVSIAAAAQPEADSKEKGRVVVVGDSEFVTNTQLPNVGNADFADNILQWLLQRRKLVSLEPKPPEQVQLNLNGEQMARLFWISILGMPLMSLGMGGVVWWRRRI